MEKETRERGGSGVDRGQVDIGTGEIPKLGTGILVSCEENVHGAGEHEDVRLRKNDLGSMQCGSGISEPLNQGDQGTIGDSHKLEDVIVIDPEENSFQSKQNGALIVKSKESGSSEALAEASQRFMIQDRDVEGGINETIGQVDKGSHGNSNNSQNGSVVEMVVMINAQEAVGECGGNRVTEMKGNGLGSSKVLGEKPKAKLKISEADNSCVIDIKGGANGGREFKETSDGERVCRICHLSSEQSLEFDVSTSTTATAATVLIQLGCGCKDELGIAHSHCAEAWFKLKGNRLCEICGESAKNVTGVGDNRFIEEWNEERSTLGGSNSSNRGGGCWRGQPFCNFLMACLVIAFVLPWFFRVNII